MLKLVNFVEPLNINMLFLFFFLFLGGLIGIVLNRKNFLLTLLNIELMYLGIISSLLGVSLMIQDTSCQVYALVILILAACESAIGLGILIILYRYGKSLNFANYENLHG